MATTPPIVNSAVYITPCTQLFLEMRIVNTKWSAAILVLFERVSSKEHGYTWKLGTEPLVTWIKAPIFGLKRANTYALPIPVDHTA